MKFEMDQEVWVKDFPASGCITRGSISGTRKACRSQGEQYELLYGTDMIWGWLKECDVFPTEAEARATHHVGDTVWKKLGGGRALGPLVINGTSLRDSTVWHHFRTISGGWASEPDSASFSSEAEARAEYKVGQEVWAMGAWHSEPILKTVKSVHYLDGQVLYGLYNELASHAESVVYPTREAVEAVGKGEGDKPYKDMPQYGVRVTCQECWSTFACNRRSLGDIVDEVREHERNHVCGAGK